MARTALGREPLQRKQEMTRPMLRLKGNAGTPAGVGWNLKKTVVVAGLVLGTTGCQTLEQGGQMIRDTFASSDPCASSARNVGIVTLKKTAEKKL